jgi:hypothetical protein
MVFSYSYSRGSGPESQGISPLSGYFQKTFDSGAYMGHIYIYAASEIIRNPLDQ